MLLPLPLVTILLHRIESESAVCRGWRRKRCAQQRSGECVRRVHTLVLPRRSPTCTRRAFWLYCAKSDGLQLHSGSSGVPGSASESTKNRQIEQTKQIFNFSFERRK